MNRIVLFFLSVSMMACTTVRQVRDHSTLKPDGHAERARNDDALEYTVATEISASPETIWAVLADGPAYLAWNSTIVKLEGAVVPGGKLALISKDAPDRTFDLAVTTFEPPKKMVWEDGGSMFLGVRTFSLLPGANGTVFAMSETFSGGMLGFIEGKLPDFTKTFETFAADLKREAERRSASDR